jgi:hypothetical protein
MRINIRVNGSMSNAFTSMAKWSIICRHVLKLGYILLLQLLTLGDIPLAFIMTIAASKPFTSEDQALGIAYVSVIIVWCFLTMFPFGGWMLIKRDFEIPLPRNDVENSHHSTSINWITRVKATASRRREHHRVEMVSENGKQADSTNEKPQCREIKIDSEHAERHSTSIDVRELDVIRPVSQHSQIRIEQTELQDLSLAATPSLTRVRSLTTSTPLDPLWKRGGRKFLKFLLSLISPPAISILLSLLIALIPTLKALFVPGVPGTDIPDAPDGMPPLAWILDIATFGG